MNENKKIINYDRDMFIFGESIDVPLVGKVRFLNYKEYLMNINDLSIISMNVLHIYHQYRKMIGNENAEEALEAIEELKKEKLMDIVRSHQNFVQSYIKVFSLVLDENDEESAVEAIRNIFSNEDLFMEFRMLILEMQMVVEEFVSPNPEIQEGIEASKKLKREEGESLTPIDIATSIVAGTANSFEDVCNMTVIQVNAIFYRIGAFKNYDASTLFATVSADVKIESWSKKIDLFQKEIHGIKKKDFDKKYGSLLNK
ncbi:hypothetical protein ABE073_03935 [Lederbergia citrisecunda]|uniref:hypothetical protein n=1 Tax=Lederbergia citrisecunda TaxID=2833583 RepID=UPI003D2E31C1